MYNSNVKGKSVNILIYEDAYFLVIQFVLKII